MHRAIALPAAIRAGARTSLPRLASSSTAASIAARPSDGLRLYSSRLPNASRPSRVVRRAGAVAGVPKRMPHSQHQNVQDAQGEGAHQGAPSAQPSSVQPKEPTPTSESASKIEMMNIFMGYEQANRYALFAPDVDYVPGGGGGGGLLSDNEVGLRPVGYLVEEEGSFFGGAMRRQFMRTHRPFKALVMDLEGNVLMRVDRPFTFINSRARVYVPTPTANSLLKDEASHEASDAREEACIGEVQQVWHPWRRKLDVFKMQRTEEGEEEMTQFAKVDSGLLAWDFLFQDEQGRLMGAVNRNFRGFGRELLTDTGQYVLRFDSLTEASQEELQAQVTGNKQGEEDSSKKLEGGQTSASHDPAVSDSTSTSTSTDLVPTVSTRSMSLPERALALALAMSADIDYFSRHSQSSGGGMGFMPLWFPFGGGGGGGAAAEGEVGGASGHEINTQRQDSSGVEAPVQPPGSDIYGPGGAGGAVGTGVGYGMMGGGAGGAVGTGVGYGMMGGGRQSRDSDDGDGPSAPPLPAASDGGGESSPWASEEPGSGGFYDSPPPPPTDGWGGSLGGEGQGEEVWGSNGQDPWAQAGESGGGDGGGGLFGGWSLGDIFGGDE